MLTFLIATAFLAAATATPVPLQFPYPHGRIVGGHIGDIDTFRYLVTIQYANRPVCAGVIISDYYMITAAHCVDPDKQISSITIRIDSNQRYVNGEVHRIEKILIHENYKVNEHGIPINDIALIRLKDPLGANSRTSELYKPSEETAVGVEATVTGWATDGDSTIVSPVRFTTATVLTIGKDLCEEAYLSFGRLPSGQICAAYHGEAGNDACQGDSGAPLIVKGRIAGILSWGNGCAKPHFPAVYTEIAHYRDWIDEHAYLAPLSNLSR